MCGRYVRKDVGEVVVSYFEVNDVRAAWNPCFNVAPSTLVPVVRLENDGRRELGELKWGLVPAWVKDDSKLSPMINARAETVATKRSYRNAFKSRRCIVPASGYFEWKKLPDGKRQPYYFQRRDGRMIAFAGIWEGQTVATLTTEPNAEAAAVHDRMPVILETENFARFLVPEPLGDGEWKRLLLPSPKGTLESWPVDRAVGNVRNNNPGLILPLSNVEDLFIRREPVA